MDDASTDSDVSVLGQEARIEGTLASADSILIYGHVRGALLVEGDVSVSAESLLEANVRAGTITFAGHAKGNLIASGDVYLARYSRVEGEVRARSVAADGLVEGNVVAQDRVELGRQARVDGDITCRILVIVEGAVFCGRCVMGER
jgi:cytoskeletal protein CcmA (bactofilin family)